MLSNKFSIALFVFILLTQNSSLAQTGLDSSRAILLICGQTIDETTTGSPSVVTKYKNVEWNESGPEDLFKVMISETSRLIVALTNLSVNLDVFILDSCSATKCVAYGDRKAIYPNATPGRYYIVVDGRDNAVGSYSLTVQSETGFLDRNKILWSEDFEVSPETNWHTDYGVWEMGVPASGPNSAFVGKRCAATKLASDYPDNVNTRLIRHFSFVVPEASQLPRLRFWHWYRFNLEDYGIVQIKLEGSTVWQNLSNVYYKPHSSNVWTCSTLDLSSYAGKTVQISFLFHSADNWSNGWDVDSGWYIDNIAVVFGQPKFINPEQWHSGGVQDWNISSGTWEIGVPTCGPDNAFSTPSCAATVLDGSYGDDTESCLISPAILIPPINKNPSLRFHHWFSFNLEDWGNVEIRTLKKENWTVLDHYVGTSYGWFYAYFNLAAYADSSVQICFRFHSADNWSNGWDTDYGWYIDDIEIQGFPTTIDEFSSNKNIIKSFFINQNYPNPFNPSTTIEFSIPHPSQVSLKIYDVLGKEVSTLVDEELPAGINRVNWNAQHLASGVYIYRIQAGKFVQTKKMILMR